MFLLSLIPDSWYQIAVNGILVIGILSLLIGFSFKFFPPFKSYSKLSQIIGYILLIVGVYFEGGYSNEMMHRNQVAELKQKIAEAESKSQQIQTKIETKTVTKIQRIKEKVNNNANSIQQNAQVIDAECTFPTIAVELHNRAAHNEISRSATDIDDAMSGSTGNGQRQTDTKQSTTNSKQ